MIYRGRDTLGQREREREMKKRKRSIGRLRLDSEEMRRRDRRRLRFSVSPPPPERRGPRIAHPGGKITHNKDEALRLYLDRLREKGQTLSKAQRVQLYRLYGELICMVRNWLASRGFKRTSKSLSNVLNGSDVVPRATLNELISGHWREEEEEQNGYYYDENDDLHRSIHHSLHEKNSRVLASRGEYDVVVEDDEDDSPDDERRSLFLNEEAEDEENSTTTTHSLLLMSNVRKLQKSKKKKRRRLRKSKL